MRLRRNMASALIMAATLLAALCRAQSTESPSVGIDANQQSQKGQDGGNVLPPNASPYGYSLDDMAKALALFDTSGNDLSYYPKTPFQILYADPKKTIVTT